MQDKAPTELSPGHREQHILGRRGGSQMTACGPVTTGVESHLPPTGAIPGVSDAHLLPCTDKVASV